MPDGSVQARVLRDVLDERDRQDDEWGGAAHDDTHLPVEWLGFIDKQRRKAFFGMMPVNRDPGAYRRALVKVAALAMAAIESLDRLAARGERQG
jgi:hypothetical protein